MNVFDRREFLNRAAILSAAAAAGGVSVAPSTATAAQRSANDKLRVAVVGVRSRGMAHVSGFLGKNNCEITTVCDCDSDVIKSAMTRITEKQGKAPKFVQDFRKVVEDKDVDVVSIATPNHWHALMAIWAMQNGKDVYCEKPMTHNVREGAIMAAVAKKTGRVCQVGTQSRSNPGMRDAINYVQTKLGKVDLAIGLCYKNRPSIGKVDGPQKPPSTMDYDLWCGPAPLEMPHRNVKNNGTVHYDWHWIWNYGNGDLGNQGVHEMDKARWGLGQTTMPNSAVSVGGRFGYTVDGETANTQVALFEYDNGNKMVFEVRGLKSGAYKGAGVGNIWVGTEGYVVCPNYAGGIAYDKAGKEVARFGWGKNSKGEGAFIGDDQNHFNNFVKAVRGGKSADLTCDVQEGHLSAALCHLANISYRLGSETPFASDIGAFGDCKDANDAVARMKEHLKGNGVDLAKAVGRVGPKLAIDVKKETITSRDGELAKKANDMLFREYRKGFEVKEA
jgi:predicted dehydrogenase